MTANAEDPRTYGVWAGNPDGTPEQIRLCIVEVPVGGRSFLFRQCSRPRGHGPKGEYCKQHAKKLAARERKDGQ